ncbi:MAG: HAMP domain-containing sensor histidine kinase [Bacteroidota bacterium]|nr:HAMP domain-containing sensor histidine kinase [Bacteroidota bacterium]
MSKRIFVLLLVLMSVSLIGIIFIQYFFILKNYEENNKQFSINVNYVLEETTSDIERNEFRKYVRKFRDLIANEALVDVDTLSIQNLIIIDENPEKRETIIYKNGVIEENLIIPKTKSYYDDIIDVISERENISIKRLSNQREEKVFSNRRIEDNLSPEQFLLKVGKISKSKEVLFESAYNDISKRNPIEERIGDINKFEKIIERNLERMNINLDFEYAIFDQDSITKISSEKFDLSNQSYSSLIFKDENDLSNYSLKVAFPGRTPFLLGSLVSVIITSIIFTSIIIIAYVTTILLLLRQRQISQIKTDFINNMTHEFKTPIATINLALSAIKNPKTIVNKEKVKKYLQMIYDENNRMHDQVENVLMISHLERNQLNIEKTKQDINEIIDLAISHVSLIVENNNGNIITEKDADNSMVIGNETHLINVMVNILDNAIKYNDNSPEIFIKTLNIGSRVLIEIKDNGIGMSKAVQSKIFEKFYRKQTGDLHDVKGHGLGLAYVKKIIAFHNGNITVDSAVGKGSKFTIQLNTLTK